MLPAALRMRGSEDFARTIRAGSRAVARTLVVHCAAHERPVSDAEASSHVGFVVSRSVGNAVTRNVVRRRLRGAVVEMRDTLPAGCDVVVRALPPAAAADFGELSHDLRSALERAERRRTGNQVRTGGSGGRP